MTKFSIIISQKEEMHLPRRIETISQKIMDEEECKNLWTRRNAKIHRVILPGVRLLLFFLPYMSTRGVCPTTTPSIPNIAPFFFLNG
jgi:hypothetical protein